MPSDDGHTWLTFPWYKICADCYDVIHLFHVGPQENGEYADQSEAIIRDPTRPWTEISTRDPIFMNLMRSPRCPTCGTMVVEENGTRSDGTKYAGFTCQGCSLRWWVNDEAKD